MCWILNCNAVLGLPQLAIVMKLKYCAAVFHQTLPIEPKKKKKGSKTAGKRTGQYSNKSFPEKGVMEYSVALKHTGEGKS